MLGKKNKRKERAILKILIAVINNSEQLESLKCPKIGFMKITAVIKNDELGLAYVIGSNVHDIK